MDETTAWAVWAAAVPEVGDDFTREVMERLHDRPRAEERHPQVEQLVARPEASE